MVDWVTTTFAKDLTELDPPAHVQLVDQTIVLPETELNVLH
jgi:hypothetical protein